MLDTELNSHFHAWNASAATSMNRMRNIPWILTVFFLSVSVGCQPVEQATPSNKSNQPKMEPSEQLDTPESNSNASKKIKEALQRFESLRSEDPQNAAAKISPTSNGLTDELERCTTKLLELATANPKSDQSFAALQAVCLTHRFGDKRKSAFKQLQTQHLDNPLIGKFCLAQSRNSGPEVEQLIVRVAEKSSNREARALAIYARSKLYNFTRTTQQQFKAGGSQIEEMRKQLPEEIWNYVMNFEYDDKLTRGLLQSLVDDYSDIEIDGQAVKKIATDAIKYLDQTK